MIFNRKPYFSIVFLLVTVCIFQSCIPKNKFLFVFNRTSVKHPPKDSTPFVFDNQVIIKPGIISKDEENRLESELSSYWDDTIKARSIQQFGAFYRIKNPQRFDTIGLSTSELFMRSYLQSQGYYHAVLKDTFRIDTFKFGTRRQQFRVTPIMNIDPGKRLKFDSIAFNFYDTSRPMPSDTVLQRLAMQKAEETLLKKNDPYSKQIIAAELDRLAGWYRQNGFYKLTRENLVAYVDTTDQLIDSLIIDPFELARKVAEATERRRQNPTADVTVMQATKAKEIPFDSAAVKQYRIGNVYYYPETRLTDITDSLLAKNNFNIQRYPNRNVYIKYPGSRPRFRIETIWQHSYLRKDSLYNETSFYKTINSFNQMGPWQQVEVRDSIRQDTVDFHIFLSRLPRMNIKFDFELTRSSGDFASSNNLFGIGGNVTFLHRNLFRKAIQSTTTPRLGAELNLENKEQLLQTILAGVNQTFSIPSIPNIPFVTSLFIGKRPKRFDYMRSIINLNANYTDRRDFFRLRSFTATVGFEKQRNRVTQSLKPINLELYSLDTLQQLIEAFKYNPFLRTAFNTGTVVSIIYTRNQIFPSKRNPYLSHSLRIGFEGAGWPIAFHHPWKNDLYQYLKLEVEYVGKIQKSKSAKIVRGFAGIGYNLNKDPVYGKSLPFFKQFVAGGPNSMRAWGLRQLGLGSSKLSDTASTFRDRFGDLQLEANFEWRFQVVDLGSAKYNSAVFVDMGNLWNIKKDPANPKAQFLRNHRIGDLGEDLAIAAGVGLLRLNVANFIFRVDFALKIKDPAVTKNGGWLNLSKFTWKNENDRNNYAIQIGIGLPF